MLFNKTIRMYYSLFMFRFYYKIISLSFTNLAGRRLVGLPVFGLRLWARPGRETCGLGPNINGMGRA